MKFTCPAGHNWKSQRFQPQPWESICPECQLPALPSLKAKQARPGLSAVESPQERELHAHFTQAVTAWPCFFSDRVDNRKRRPDHKCWGPIDPHHLVPVEYMKRQLGLPFEVMYDPILGVPLCRLAHEAVERSIERIYWDELDPDCIDFCAKHGLLPRLELESPKRRESAA
jgi:hypothetical protein